MILTTTDGVEGRRIVEYKGLVAGQAIYGANFMKDFFAGIRDVVGGRSGGYEKVVAGGRQAALEDMAGLFRALMADNRELAPLADEIELCRQYLDLEQLRLGDRLQIEWHIDKMPRDALVPPLALQPLLENAVYHGIEPSETPGVVSINIYAVRDRLHVVLRNPYNASGAHHAGNKMAVGNIRERLQLHFDVAAELTTRVGDNLYEVRIAMPYVRAERS